MGERDRVTPADAVPSTVETLSDFQLHRDNSCLWRHAALGKYQLLVNVCFWPKAARFEWHLLAVLG